MSHIGSQKFAVLLCKFSDNTVEPFTPDFYKQLIAMRGTGSLNDYWIAASQGAINLDGTDILGWVTIDQKQQDFLNARPGRWDKIQGAIDAFPNLNISQYAGIIAMFNSDVGDGGNAGIGVLASPTGMSVTFLAHETGHVFGLEHSFDQSDRKDATWSAPGEYFDKHDIMSAMNVYDFENGNFGDSGPLLCAANLDRMGWLNSGRLWKLSQSNSSWSGEFDLVSMSHPEKPGYIAAHIGNVYVEFRTVEGWDRAIPRPCVLFHQLFDPNAIVIAYDKAAHVNDWQPGQTYGPSDLLLGVFGGTQITVKSFDLRSMTARIAVRFVAARPLVVGPGQSLGVGPTDGGGWLFLNGRVIRIPPRGPEIFVAAILSIILRGLGALRRQFTRNVEG